MDNEHLLWTETGRSAKYEHRIFTLYESARLSHDGMRANWVMIDSPDWGNVAAFTRDAEGRDCLVLVRQFRPGLETTALEFPGGVIERDEDPLAGLQRELREETGYQSERWIHLGSVNPNPSFLSNTNHSWLALDCKLAHRQELDAQERLDCLLVPLAELTAGAHPEFFSNGIMLLTWHWLGERLRREALPKHPAQETL